MRAESGARGKSFPLMAKLALSLPDGSKAEAYFERDHAVAVGPVLVAGPFTVFGVKAAGVKDSRGFYRQLFCMERPESCFEDFGEAALVNGKVKLDLQFASLVRTKGYHAGGDRYR